MVARTLLLEVAAHEQERRRRAGIGTGVHHEREGAPGLEEHTAQGRTDDAHGRRPTALRARGLGQLLGGHDRPQGSRLGGVENGRADAQGSTQKGTPPTTRLIARPAMAAARKASAPIINARLFQRSAARPAGMARMATGAVRAKETRPAFTAEWVRASARSG